MKRPIPFFLLLAVLFPLLAWAQSPGSVADGQSHPARGSKSLTEDTYQSGQSSHDSGVSTKLPFNFLNGLYMSRCMESSRLGEFDSAIEACSKAIELDPGNIFAHRLRGLAYEKKGDSRKAAQDCEAAERLGDRECRSWLKQAAHTENEKKGGALTLLCRVSFAGGAPGDYSLVVNLTSGTVNGWKASINDNVIQWKQKDAWFRVDRYTGVFDGANMNDSGTYSGRCTKTTEKRQF